MNSIALLRLTVLAGAVAILPLGAGTALAQGERPQRGGSGTFDPNRPPGARGPQAPAVWGLYASAQVAERGRDFETAHDLIEQALRRDPNDLELARAAFRLRLMTGRVTAAAEIAQRRLTKEAEPGLINLVIGAAAVKRGDYKVAEQHLLRLSQDMDLGILRPYAAAWLRAGQKDFAGARTQLEAAKPPANDRAVAPHLVIGGLIDEMAGDKTAAEAKLRQALELDAEGLRTIVSVANFFRRNGKVAEARDILRRYGERHADTVSMEAMIASEQPPRAPTPADGIAELLFDLGGAVSSLRREGADQMALLYARMALDLKPDLDVGRILAAELYEQMDRPAKAIEMYQAIDPQSPLQWRARLRATSLLSETDRLEEALRLLRTMVNERPERYDAPAALADLFRQKERYTDSIAAYDTALGRIKATEARHWPMFYARGIAHERAKQWPKAEADFNKALELSPDQAYVLNYLGYSWIDMGMHLDKGMELLLKANRLRPNDGAITDSVGWAYYRLGQYDKAVEWLEKAIELKADDATIVEHLGDAYWQVGRKREARFQWERALRQKPEADRIEPIKEKLVSGLQPEKPAAQK
jgi:tetratricopeptide (TPR) repeat protein